MNIQRWRTKLLLIIALASFLIAGTVYTRESKDQKSFLWKVESKTAKVFILGSIHIANKSLYPLRKPIMDSFHQSEILIVEVNTADMDQKKMQQLMLRHGYYTDGRTLKETLPEDLYKLLDTELRSNNIQTESFNRMKPWMAALTFTVVKMMRAKYEPEYGVESYFLKIAKDKKKIEELESADFQVKLLSGWTEKQQQMFLRQTLQEDTTDDFMKKIVAAWKEGNGEFILKSMIDPYKKDPEMISVYKKLFADRNITMTEKIEKYLNGSRVCFVIVGVGHLIGDDGIIHLLQGKKYRIERL